MDVTKKDVQLELFENDPLHDHIIKDCEKANENPKDLTHACGIFIKNLENNKKGLYTK